MIYFQFISIINLYMFRAGLLLIHIHTRTYRVAPPDDEQYTCLKQVEVNY